MKTHVLLECETYVQTALITYQQFKKYEQYNDIEVILKLTRKIKRSDLEWSDIVISIRGQCSLSTKIAHICNKYNILHMVLLDDNLFIQSRTDAFMKRRQNELSNILNQTNVLISGNELLANKIKKQYAVKRVVHFDTAVSQDHIHKEKRLKRGKNIKIVYYSNDGSSNYFEKVIVPVLENIQMRICKNIEIQCIGMNKIKGFNAKVKITYVSHMELERFRKYLAESGFAVGVAPLPNRDGFSEYKYFNKFLEFSMAGIPGIYSNVPPYTYIIKNGENGILCNNSIDEWVNAIQTMITDQTIADSIVGNSQRQLEEEFSVEKQYAEFCNQFPELIKYRSLDTKISFFDLSKIEYYVFWIFEKANSVYRALKKGGFKYLLARTSEFVLTNKQTKETKKESNIRRQK